MTPYINFLFPAPSKVATLRHESCIHPLPSPAVPTQMVVHPKALGAPTASTRAGLRGQGHPHNHISLQQH